MRASDGSSFDELIWGTDDHLMQQAVNRIGLPKGTLHTLRHRYATLLLTDGVPPNDP